jgi:hypothetical protein
MKSSKPTCRDDIIVWFQNVEEKKQAGLEPGSHVVSPWFHGLLYYIQILNTNILKAALIYCICYIINVLIVILTHSSQVES